MQEMYSAKITRCRHFFHGVCLRKWLYVQDRCPLCHEIMMYTDKADENAQEADPAAAVQAEQPIHINPRDVSSKCQLWEPIIHYRAQIIYMLIFTTGCNQCWSGASLTGTCCWSCFGKWCSRDQRKSCLAKRR